MTSVPAVPEFRETDQYWKPLLTHGVDIIRPKPRRLGDMSKTTESCRPSTRDLLMVPLKFHNRDIVGGSAPILNKSSSREVLTPLQSSKGTGLTESSSPSIQICKTPTNGLSFHKTPTRDKMASPCSQRSQQIHNGGNFSQSGRPSSRESIHHAKSSPGLTNSSWDKGEDEGVAADGSLSPYLDSTSNTDCGSLSKSSSDGDPVICRKRPPTRLKSRRRNILSFPQLHLDDAKLLQRRQDCYGGSSSDENRSSGHASMSDGHSSFISSSPTDCVLSRSHAKVHGNRYQHENNENNNDFSENKDFYAADQKILCRGTPLKAVPEDDRLSVATNRHSTSVSTKVIGRRNAGYRKGTHRVREELLPVEGIAGLDDIRYAIEQLSAKNNNCRTNYSTSTYSSMSGSESESVRRLIRHSSLETINTNITNADEFVWIDSHSRLVELQHLPWSNHDVLRVIQTGRLAEHLSRISMETVPRLAYLLQRPLVRISREAQRFSRTLGMCSKQEVSGALKVILSPAMSDSCIKACLRSGAIYAVSGDQLKLSKSARAGLQLSVGRFHRWMCDVRIGTFIHEYAAIYLTAALENLMEEVLLQCLPNDGESMLTASVLESSIANNGDLWGLFQPYSHLNAGRTATGRCF
ncbi:uncharacterized protein LOC111640410, partial [Centruroides sculpturatus]|uniref:uncharacterized protein LOC111640410 n=1 Tax=Centruroides sculpturatus TaxID=218467 RepID=UPI000C6CB25A